MFNDARVYNPLLVYVAIPKDNIKGGEDDDTETKDSEDGKKDSDYAKIEVTFTECMGSCAAANADLHIPDNWGESQASDIAYLEADSQLRNWTDCVCRVCGNFSEMNEWAAREDACTSALRFHSQIRDINSEEISRRLSGTSHLSLMLTPPLKRFCIFNRHTLTHAP